MENQVGSGLSNSELEDHKVAMAAEGNPEKPQDERILLVSKVNDYIGHLETAYASAGFSSDSLEILSKFKGLNWNALCSVSGAGEMVEQFTHLMAGGTLRVTEGALGLKDLKEREAFESDSLGETYRMHKVELTVIETILVTCQDMKKYYSGELFREIDSLETDAEELRRRLCWQLYRDMEVHHGRESRNEEFDSERFRAREKIAKKGKQYIHKNDD